ncbi:MAG: YcaO-like family protein [Minisyncoccia bacterium]
MLKDTASFESVWLAMHGSSRSAGAITSFIRFLERRLGAEFVYDKARIGYEPLELATLLELAEILRANGTIRSYERGPRLPDEPRIAYWRAEYALGNGKYERSGGNALDNQPLALTKALAEAIERNAWFSCDTFAPLRSATAIEMEKSSRILNPERFAGYSDAQRAKHARLEFKSTDSFSWVEGYSWVQKKPIWVPSQTVSGHTRLQAFSPSSKEPAIRSSITTGLATHPDRTQALLSGALEVIERDAYIITWLNQVSAPRMNLDELSAQSESLARLITLCRRYRLEPSAVRLPTDAPAYAVCAVLEDATGTRPRFSIGLKANGNPATAIEGALLEALRMHQGTRQQMQSPRNDWDPAREAIDIKQYDRLLYYTEEGRGDRLAFLTKGPVRSLKKEVWETDTPEEHFKRIVEWCRKKEYELVSVSLSNAPANIPRWHIEFVVIPEMQPLHYNEKLPHLGGKRLQEIPKQFGYEPRKHPYLDDPHPFA